MTLQLHEFWHPNAENFGMRVACSNFNMSLCYFNEWSVICHFSCNQSGKSLSLMQVTKPRSLSELTLDYDFYTKYLCVVFWNIREMLMSLSFPLYSCQCFIIICQNGKVCLQQTAQKWIWLWCPGPRMWGKIPFTRCQAQTWWFWLPLQWQGHGTLKSERSPSDYFCRVEN